MGCDRGIEYPGTPRLVHGVVGVLDGRERPGADPPERGPAGTVALDLGGEAGEPRPALLRVAGLVELAEIQPEGAGLG